MIFWVDAQLSPQLATWLQLTFGVSALPVRDLGLRDAGDRLAGRGHGPLARRAGSVGDGR